MIAFKDLDSFIECQFLGQHQCDLGQLDTKGIAVDAVELTRANERNGFRLLTEILFSDCIL